VSAAIKAGEYVEKWDDVTKTPYAYSEDKEVYLTFDNRKSVELKLQLLQEKKLAGAMFWAIDLDDFKGGYPLISQVATTLRPKTPPENVAQKAARK
jgi:chitinase